MLLFVGFYRHYRGGPLLNVFVRVYFDVFYGFYRHYFVSFFLCVLFFVCGKGGGPKRISEGQC